MGGRTRRASAKVHERGRYQKFVMASDSFRPEVHEKDVLHMMEATASVTFTNKSAIRDALCLVPRVFSYGKSLIIFRCGTMARKRQQLLT